MDQQQSIDRLIDAYHWLNTDVRQSVTNAGNNDAIEDIVRSMRDDELRFSEALRERTTGVATPEMLGGEAIPSIGTERARDPLPVLIAQFGSAREVTLGILRGLLPEQWDASSANGASIRTHVTELAENDQRQLARIRSLLSNSTLA